MSIAFSTAVPVVQLTQNFNFEMHESGQRGTRVFVDASVRPDLSSEDLPAIGSGWSDDYSGCRLRNIRVTYIQDNDNCGRRFECVYDTQSNDDSNALTNQSGAGVTNDVTKLACQVDAGSDSVTWEPWEEPSASRFPTGTKFTHKWTAAPGAGQDVKQLVFKRTITGQFSVERIIKDSKFRDWLEKSWSKTGKLNDAEFFQFPAGTLLYTGCQMAKTWTQFGTSTKREWKGNLIFIYKSVTGSPTAGLDGWNWILREDTGEWNKPQMKTVPAGQSGFLYESADFSELLTFGGWDVTLPTMIVNK